MSERMAVKVAIDLLHVPSQVRLVRSQPLPVGVPLLLRIAAGDSDAEQTAIAQTGRSRDVVLKATAFFIEQILFAPDGGSYRVLGANPQAGASELRQNAALLLRWLHPDCDPQGKRSMFVGKVTAAWNDLKTPARRASYDELHQQSIANKGRSKSLRRGYRWRLPATSRRNGYHWDRASMDGAEETGFLRRALSILLHRPSQ
jgi:hypothetical protein